MSYLLINVQLIICQECLSNDWHIKYKIVHCSAITEQKQPARNTVWGTHTW